MVVERASRPGRQLDETAVAALAAAVRGELIRPGDADYDAARAVYNAMIDRHPALIVRCADVADVIAAVNFAREQGLLLAVRGGGHNGPGLGVCDDGLVIDLAPLRGIRVDPPARRAWRAAAPSGRCITPPTPSGWRCPAGSSRPPASAGSPSAAASAT
jgi:hypothetical protein